VFKIIGSVLLQVVLVFVLLLAAILLIGAGICSFTSVVGVFSLSSKMDDGIILVVSVVVGAVAWLVIHLSLNGFKALSNFRNSKRTPDADDQTKVEAPLTSQESKHDS
jgi:uncharacterized membrane protein YgaE (UPF0421/DUF939 family)